MQSDLYRDIAIWVWLCYANLEEYYNDPDDTVFFNWVTVRCWPVTWENGKKGVHDFNQAEARRLLALERDP